MATEHGLELYQQLSKGQGLRYMGSRKHPTSWCIYSHESRIALLATGEGGLWLQVITNASETHFSSSGFSTLGKMSMGSLSLLVCMQPMSTAAGQLLAECPNVWQHALHTAARQTAVQHHQHVIPLNLDWRHYSSIPILKDQLYAHMLHTSTH